MPRSPMEHGYAGYFAQDQTKREDAQEQPFHNPQVHDGYHNIPLWGHRIDNHKAASYSLRQLMAMPHTFAGWVRLFGFPMFGGVVKYASWQAILIMNWYAAIPIAVLVLPLTAGFFVSFKNKDVRYPTLMKYALMLLGGIL